MFVCCHMYTCVSTLLCFDEEDDLDIFRPTVLTAGFGKLA